MDPEIDSEKDEDEDVNLRSLPTIEEIPKATTMKELWASTIMKRPQKMVTKGLKLTMMCPHFVYFFFEI